MYKTAYSVHPGGSDQTLKVFQPFAQSNCVMEMLWRKGADPAKKKEKG